MRAECRVQEGSVKLLAIVGSPRLDGNTNYLVDQALAEAARLSAETEKIILSQHKVNPCQGHDDCDAFDACQQQDDASWILDKMVAADGVILATPVYYYNVSAQLKSFMDRNYFLYMHDQKARARAVGVIVVAGGEGIDDTVNTLRRFINGSFNVDSKHVFTVTGYAGGAGKVKSNASFVSEARRLGKQIVEALRGA